jgi:NTE family protein
MRHEEGEPDDGGGDPMTTAFVLSGGGSLGAVQVGMLQALAENDIHPDLLIGTSAGALNASWVAVHGMSAESLDELAAIWTALRRSEVFPIDVRHVVRAALGLGTAVCSTQRLDRLVSAHAGIENIEDATVPLHLIASDLLAGTAECLSDGPLTEGVLASAAIPGVFPPVQRNGRPLVDGVVSGHSGVSDAVELGADTVFVLPTGAACDLPRPPHSAIGVALHALTMLIERRLANEMAAYGDEVTIKILPPLCPLSVSPTDFSHGAELIDRSRRAALDWIGAGGIDLPSPARFLSAHHHVSADTRHGTPNPVSP